jgi:hypothetical protein
MSVTDPVGADAKVRVRAVLEIEINALGECMSEAELREILAKFQDSGEGVAVGLRAALENYFTYRSLRQDTIGCTPDGNREAMLDEDPVVTVGKIEVLP